MTWRDAPGRGGSKRRSRNGLTNWWLEAGRSLLLGFSTFAGDWRFWRTITLVPLSPTTNHNVPPCTWLVPSCAVALRPVPARHKNLGSKVAATGSPLDVEERIPTPFDESLRNVACTFRSARGGSHARRGAGRARAPGKGVSVLARSGAASGARDLACADDGSLWRGHSAKSTLGLRSSRMSSIRVRICSFHSRWGMMKNFS